MSIVKNNYDKIFQKISEEYNENFTKYGNCPKSVGQLDIQTLE